MVMSAPLVESSGVGFSLQSTGGTWTWQVQSRNIQNFGQLFEVFDIRSPFGALSSVSIPLPGDVVQAMSSSITQLSQQVAANITISSPSPPSFFLTVSEGDSVTDVGVIVFSNSGAFGSFLNASATSSVSWLTVAPTQILGIAKGQTGQFSVTVDPNQLTAVDSPWNGTITIQDDNNPTTVLSVPIIVTVLPAPEIDVVPTAFTFCFNLMSQTGTGAQILTVTNTGPVTSKLDFVLAKVQNTSNWLNVSPISGGPLDTGESAPITLSLITSAVPQLAGSFTDTLRVSSVNATNSPIDIPITLEVSATGGAD